MGAEGREGLAVGRAAVPDISEETQWVTPQS